MGSGVGGMGSGVGGVSKGMFVVGLVVAILVSSGIGMVVSSQLSFGPKGDKGDTGSQGQQGIQGVKGDKGDTGATGLQGIQGIQGIQGLQGEQGIQGPAITYGIGNLSGWLPAPAYDSGWTLIPEDQWYNFTHGLNTKELVVYLLGRDAQGTITQLGLNAYIPAGYTPIYWQIVSPNEIQVRKTQYAWGWGLVRVLAWKIAEP